MTPITHEECYCRVTLNPYHPDPLKKKRELVLVAWKQVPKAEAGDHIMSAWNQNIISYDSSLFYFQIVPPRKKNNVGTFNLINKSSQALYQVLHKIWHSP